MECIDRESFRLSEYLDTSEMSDEMTRLGMSLGSSITETGLIGFGDEQPLGIHSETILRQLSYI